MLSLTCPVGRLDPPRRTRPSQKEVPLTMITNRELATMNRRAALPLYGATAPVLFTAR